MHHTQYRGMFVTCEDMKKELIDKILEMNFDSADKQRAAVNHLTRCSECQKVWGAKDALRNAQKKLGEGKPCHPPQPGTSQP